MLPPSPPQRKRGESTGCPCICALRRVSSAFMTHPSSPHIAATAADRPSRCGSALTGAPAHPPAYVVGRGFFYAGSAVNVAPAQSSLVGRSSGVTGGEPVSRGEHGCRAPAAERAAGDFYRAFPPVEDGPGRSRRAQVRFLHARPVCGGLLSARWAGKATRVPSMVWMAGLCIPVAQHHAGIPLDGVAGSTPASRSSLSRLETGRSTARPRGGASVVGSIPTIRAESKSAASGNRRTELVRYSSDGGERPALSSAEDVMP